MVNTHFQNPQPGFSPDIINQQLFNQSSSFLRYVFDWETDDRIQKVSLVLFPIITVSFICCLYFRWCRRKATQSRTPLLNHPEQDSSSLLQQQKKTSSSTSPLMESLKQKQEELEKLRIQEIENQRKIEEEAAREFARKQEEIQKTYEQSIRKIENEHVQNKEQIRIEHRETERDNEKISQGIQSEEKELVQQSAQLLERSTKEREEILRETNKHLMSNNFNMILGAFPKLANLVKKDPKTQNIKQDGLMNSIFQQIDKLKTDYLANKMNEKDLKEKLGLVELSLKSS